VTASAVTRSMSVFKAFIRPPIRLGSSVPAAMRPARPLSHVGYDASCCREMHCRDNSTYSRVYLGGVKFDREALLARWKQTRRNNAERYPKLERPINHLFDFDSPPTIATTSPSQFRQK
jgi:hypothetical protein